MHVYGDLHGTLTSPGTISGSLSASGAIAGTLTIPNAVLPPTYEGTYEVTPTAEAQTLATDSLYMRGNITINPIPSNYGLITWNGSTLTVS
jgi:hypothetical protein